MGWLRGSLLQLSCCKQRKRIPSPQQVSLSPSDWPSRGPQCFVVLSLPAAWVTLPLTPSASAPLSAAPLSADWGCSPIHIHCSGATSLQDYMSYSAPLQLLWLLVDPRTLANEETEEGAERVAVLASNTHASMMTWREEGGGENPCSCCCVSVSLCAVTLHVCPTLLWRHRLHLILPLF